MDVGALLGHFGHTHTQYMFDVIALVSRGLFCEVCLVQSALKGTREREREGEREREAHSIS